MIYESFDLKDNGNMRSILASPLCLIGVDKSQRIAKQKGFAY